MTEPTTPPTDDGAIGADDAKRLNALISSIEVLFRGKRDVCEAAIIALLAEGHLLLEDIPGVGKTTLAKSLARALGCTFQRIQFTSDILPSDVLGVNIYDKETGSFVFKKGPVFANLVLADEINRTTPRSQSALLEAMNERQVTIDTTTYPLPSPFLVMATQNPLEFAGTYPLPESQMDRFLIRAEIGYPDPETERSIITGRGFADLAETITPVVTAEEISGMQKRVANVKLSDSLMDYLQRLLAKTRQSPYLSLGVSVRGSIGLARAAQAKAFLAGRNYVIPDDLKEIFLRVCGHRVMPKNFHDNVSEKRRDISNILGEILDRTDVPV